MPAKLPHEFVEVDYLNGNIKLLSRYVGSRVKNDLECLICKYLWKAIYNSFQSQNCGCPKCAGLVKPTQEFVEVDYLNGNIKLLSFYVNNRIKNDLECLICGYLWEAAYNNFHNNNCGCPRCSGSLKHTQEFVEAEYLKGNIKLLSLYVGALVKNDLECLICDHLWQATYGSFQNMNCGCPECWRLSRLGENNSNWNHELTKKDRENHRNRSYIPGYYQWRKAVFDRDDHTCQFCNVRGGSLEAHHIDAWKEHKKDRFNVDNGVTLCEACHDACHDYHKNALSHLSATHETFYYWMIRECKIKPENWSWIVQYPDNMNKTLFYSKRQNLNKI